MLLRHPKNIRLQDMPFPCSCIPWANNFLKECCALAREVEKNRKREQEEGEIRINKTNQNRNGSGIDREQDPNGAVLKLDRTRLFVFDRRRIDHVLTHPVEQEADNNDMD